jgi:hypothetical protein
LEANAYFSASAQIEILAVYFRARPPMKSEDGWRITGTNSGYGCGGSQAVKSSRHFSRQKMGIFVHFGAF